MSLLAETLRAKLIPWSRHNAQERFIVAHSKMSAAQMPDGVLLKRRKIVGPRVIVKNRREYGNVRSRIANWPEAGLQEWEHYKMVCVLKGQMDFQAGNYAVQCGEGFYLLLPPGMPEPDGVKSYHGESTFCDVLNIILHPHAVQCFVSHAEHGQRVECLENYLFKNSSLIMIFHTLMKEMFSGRDDSFQIGADLLCAFWATLQRDVNEQMYINPGPVGRPDVMAQKSAGFEADLLHYIQTHLNESLTLENVTRGMYISRAQFARRMRQETGKTFVQFLTDYRIAEAKVLLGDSDWTVTTIAGFLGFKSNNYFQTVFRRATGKTPGQYRTDIRKKR
jgi:AraC-like DNA-binding protein